MMEDYARPEWADNQRRFNDDIDRGLRRLTLGFAALHRFNWSAPWKRRPAPQLDGCR